MGLMPDLTKKKTKFLLKQCSCCGSQLGPDSFAPTKSDFYPDGTIPLCNDCVDAFLTKNGEGYDWARVDKICQYADIPFVPIEWEKMVEMNPTETFYRYAQMFMSGEYENLGWGDYYKAFKELKESNQLETELPGLAEERRTKLRERWGGNYDDEALNYLEQLFSGLLSTQNVSGALQLDQALKICKMSYEIDQRIAAGDDFDKLLTSYDKLVKSAEFTPKNVKNINDFDSTGELIKWMEKRGWHNPFYDRVTRDIVDETLKNIENFNRRLYTNESNIGDEINRRCEALKSTAEMENYYETDKQFDLEKYDSDGYNGVIEQDNEEFMVDEEEYDG